MHRDLIILTFDLHIEKLGMNLVFDNIATYSLNPDSCKNVTCKNIRFHRERKIIACYYGNAGYIINQ